MNLSGKTALVTGAARRIGRTIALNLATEGCDLILHFHHSEAEAVQLASEIRGMGRRCRTSRHNLENCSDTRKWFEALASDNDGIDILVNSASSYTKDRYADLDETGLNRSMAVHLLSPVAMINALYEIGRTCSIVNILDTRASGSDPAHVSYHLGKSALMKTTKEMAAEMAPRLRINGVAPGVILPPENEGEEWFKRLESSYPLETRGNIEDVAQAVLYLCKADFVTGQILYIDGGRHLKGLENEY